MEKKEDRNFCPGEDKRKMRGHNCPDKSPFLSMRQKDLSFDISLKTKDLVHFHSGRGLFSFPYDLEKRANSLLFSSFWSKIPSFFYFFFFFVLFSFLLFFFMGERKMEKKEDRDFCPGEDKRKMRRHSGFLKIIFGQKNAPKIHISRQKQPKNAKNQNYFAKNYFWRNFWGNSRRYFDESQKF